MTSGRWALLILVVAAAASLFWLLDPYFRPSYDADHYLLTARSLLDGNGYTVYGEPFTLRPPLFSFVLVPLLALFGTNFLVLNLFVSLLGVLALALVFVYFRPRLGTTITFALCVALWLNPQYRSLCTVLLSDMAGFAAALGCLLLDRWVCKRPSVGREALLGVAVGLSSLVRSVCILLVPAILFSRLLRRNPNAPPGRWKKTLSLALVLVVPILAQAPWSLWKRANPPQMPPEQFGLYSYWVGQFHEKTWDPESPRLTAAAILERVPVRIEECFKTLGSRMQWTTPKMETPTARDLNWHGNRKLAWLLGCLGFACLVAMGVWRRDPGSFFAAGTVLVLLVYFGFDPRLLLLTYVFTLATILEFLKRGLGRFLPEKAVPPLVAALVLGLGVMDFNPEDQADLKRRHSARMAIARFVNDKYPDDVAIGASQGYRLAAYFDRPIWFLELATAQRGSIGARAVIERRDLKVIIQVYTGRDNWPHVRKPITDLIRERNGKMVRNIDKIRVYEL